MLIPTTHKGLGRISWSHFKLLYTLTVWVEGAGPLCPAAHLLGP